MTTKQGYPTYNPSATLTPTTLTNSLATAVAPPPPPQLPPTLTVPQQQQSSITFQATLASSIATTQNGHLLQTNFHSNRIGYQGKKPIQNYRPGFNKQGFKPGMKRKLDEGESESKNDTLSDLMQPLYCKLCKVILNAPAQAKQHYDGKNHSRKLKMYMEGKEDQEESGQDSQVSSTNGGSPGTPPTPTSTDPIDPEIYCQICGVSFNSIKQSQQHYQGKNHAKRVRATQSEANSKKGLHFNHKKAHGGQWYCHTCKQACSSQGELEKHCLTAKHLAQAQQMLESASSALKGRWAGGITKHLGFNSRGIHTPTVHFSNRPAMSNSGPSPSKKTRGDFSNYRLPSGKFYCSMCNQTLNSEAQMANHVQSNKHKTAYAAMKTEQEIAEMAKK